MILVARICIHVFPLAHNQTEGWISVYVTEEKADSEYDLYGQVSGFSPKGGGLGGSIKFKH